MWRIGAPHRPNIGPNHGPGSNLASHTLLQLYGPIGALIAEPHLQLGQLQAPFRGELVDHCDRHPSPDSRSTDREALEGRQSNVPYRFRQTRPR